MIIGLIITWLFWIPALGLLVSWRTAYPLIVFPVIVSLAIWFVSHKSESDAIWLSVIIHALLLIKYFWGARRYKRDNKPNEWKRLAKP